MIDAWAVAVNMGKASNRWVAGARAWVIQIPGDGLTGKVLVRSRSGRWIAVWVKASMLTNPRVKWVTQKLGLRVCTYEKTEHAETVVARLASLLRKAN